MISLDDLAPVCRSLRGDWTAAMQGAELQLTWQD